MLNNTNESSTRQERRAARRKAEILEAAATVFAEKGFHRTTTKDIAEAADVAEGTIYNYFENKDDLLINLIDWLSALEQRREAYAKSLDTDFREAFHDIMLERFAILKERNTLFMAILPELYTNPHLRDLYKQRLMVPAIRDLEAHIRARVERGHLEDIDVPMAVRLLAALGFGLSILAILDDTELQAAWDDSDRLVDLFTQAVFDGILRLPEDSASKK